MTAIARVQDQLSEQVADKDVDDASVDRPKARRPTAPPRGKRHSFRKDAFFYHEGLEWRVMRVAGDQVEALSVQYQTARVFGRDDLYRTWSTGATAFPMDKASTVSIMPTVPVVNDIHLVEPAQRTKVETRLGVMQTLLTTSRQSGGRRAAIRTYVSTGNGLAKSQSYAWFKRYLNGGESLHTLLDDRSGRPESYDPRLLDIIDAEIENYYLTTVQPTVELLRDRVWRIAGEENEKLAPAQQIKLPTPIALRRKLDRIIKKRDPFTIFAGRHGRRAAETKFGRTDYLARP